MSPPTKGARRFRKFLDDHDISLRKAGGTLSVSHVTVLAWCDGRLVPSDAYKRAIEIWTGGEVVFDDWLTTAERKAREALANIQPFSATGTDGGH